MNTSRPAQAALALAAAALVLATAAPLAAQTAREKAGSELLNYIYGESADPACGVCLNAAKAHFEAKRGEELAKKTRGMALVPAGPYLLGSPEGEGDPDERPAAEIYLDAFYLDKTEVTLDEYMRFSKVTSGSYPEWAAPAGKFNLETGRDGYYRRLAPLIKACGDCPVFGVTWQNAKDYCLWKNKRLPTEAEWEAAARAGSKTPYSYGPGSAAHAHAWIESNSGEVPRPVSKKKPNKLGFYDLHGNVWEWVADYYDKAYYPLRPKKNPEGPPAGTSRVIRGGSWSADADSGRSANRASAKAPNDDIGFRCAAALKDLLK